LRVIICKPAITTLRPLCALNADSARSVWLLQLGCHDKGARHFDSHIRGDQIHALGALAQIIGELHNYKHFALFGCNAKARHQFIAIGYNGARTGQLFFNEIVHLFILD